MENIDIGAAIKSIRNELGLTQEEFAQKIFGKKRYRIADWETNRSRISAVDWIKIQGFAKKHKRQA